MNASIALSGQVAGRIDEVKTVAEIIDELVDGFLTTVSGLSARYPTAGTTAAGRTE
jgi:NAD(P)H-dependent flavin oxidoreductase YrpB (nitropropane dioxygenase family)